MINLNINSSSSQKFERFLTFTTQMHLENIRMCLNIEVVGSVHPLMHLFGSTPVSTLFYMEENFSCIWPASYIVSWQDKIKYLVSFLYFVPLSLIQAIDGDGMSDTSVKGEYGTLSKDEENLFLFFIIFLK